ncbi:hypothetical protein B0T19DRAFT_434163 [Cercophora scortea]|uniref:Uncharacterized protein n=1 Tax=Cercophora scortea TaxID=314031 RepID=A0AAE0M6E3_9PEZI|nr:hypothetical protein B0T19DRAFT_434163 [Cercophora scortea]
MCRSRQSVSGLFVLPIIGLLSVAYDEMLNQRTQAPYRWTALFFKKDIHITSPISNLTGLITRSSTTSCHSGRDVVTISCTYCATPILESPFGYGVAPINPNSIRRRSKDEKFRDAFEPVHIFYKDRFFNVIDGHKKYEGNPKVSSLVDEVTGDEIEVGEREQTNDAVYS